MTPTFEMQCRSVHLPDTLSERFSLISKAVLAEESTTIPVFEIAALWVPVSTYVQFSRVALGW